MNEYYRRQINYYETDQMGVVHHSNYIKWYEEARLDFFKKSDINYRNVEDMGIYIPVLSANINFISFTKYPEVVEIRVKIKEFNGVRMLVEYEVYNIEREELVNSGYTTHCFLNKEYKPINLKKHNNDLYMKLINKIK